MADTDTAPAADENLAPLVKLLRAKGIAEAALFDAPDGMRDGIETVVVAPAQFADAAAVLQGADFVRFLDLSAVDFIERVPAFSGRFQIFMLLYSMVEQRHARLMCFTDSSVPSVTPLFEGAHNYEREVFDLYGVTFPGHPALTRILLPDGWEGHPMRRDYEMPVEPVDFTVTRELYNT
jgi:NADH-quinone oxidoreductase subunit C